LTTLTNSASVALHPAVPAPIHPQSVSPAPLATTYSSTSVFPHVPLVCLHRATLLVSFARPTVQPAPPSPPAQSARELPTYTITPVLAPVRQPLQLSAVVSAPPALHSSVLPALGPTPVSPASRAHSSSMESVSSTAPQATLQMAPTV
jgi:hypothetical protein